MISASDSQGRVSHYGVQLLQYVLIRDDLINGVFIGKHYLAAWVNGHNQGYCCEVLVCQLWDSPILLIVLDLFVQCSVPTDIVPEYQVSHPLLTKTTTFWTS